MYAKKFYVIGSDDFEQQAQKLYNTKKMPY